MLSRGVILIFTFLLILAFPSLLPVFGIKCSHIVTALSKVFPQSVFAPPHSSFVLLPIVFPSFGLFRFLNIHLSVQRRLSALLLVAASSKFHLFKREIDFPLLFQTSAKKQSPCRVSQVCSVRWRLSWLSLGS
eukprot:GHVT01073977.1.p1 GENE.GHVT01073977.1~~GHVT01073977.1.p1  ORF type:complete len:133 (-),score=11.85 GHVT01073977.1:132-530(-)